MTVVIEDGHATVGIAQQLPIPLGEQRIASELHAVHGVRQLIGQNGFFAVLAGEVQVNGVHFGSDPAISWCSSR